MSDGVAEPAPITDDTDDVQSLVHYNETEDSFIFETKQDVEPVIKEVKRMRDHAKGEDFWHVGSIPPVVVESYCNQHGVNLHEFFTDNTHIKRIMNDPDYKHFKILEDVTL